MNTEPRNNESYPRSPAHFQLHRKKQAVKTGISGNTKILLAVPLVLCYMSSVLNCTTVSDFYSTLLLHTVPTRDKENTDSFSSSPLQPTVKFVQFTDCEDNKKAGKHKTRKIHVFCQVPELLNQFDLQHPSPADFHKYKLNLRCNCLFWHRTLKILKGSEGVKLTMLNLPRIKLAPWWPNTLYKRLVCFVNKSSRREADLGLK